MWTCSATVKSFALQQFWLLAAKHTGITCLVCVIAPMPSKFNPFPSPKKGKGRSVLKRPSTMKTKAWKNIPYVRDPNVVKKQKMDRFKWKRSLPDLLQASDAKIVHLLRQEDGLLFKWEGKTCPRCGKGCMSKLLAQPTTHLLKHRCNHRGCQAYLNPQHLHPLFLDARGSAATSLQHQAALRMLILNNVKYATIYRLLHVNHKAIEDMKRRLLGLRKPWVEEKEKEIVLGHAKTWVDIEADETTFDKVNVGTAAEDPQKPMQWDKGVALRPWSCTGWCQQRLKPGHQGQVPSARQNGHLLRAVTWPTAELSCTQMRRNRIVWRWTACYMTELSIVKSGWRARTASGDGRTLPMWTLCATRILWARRSCGSKVARRS